jgi:hypothetical protein
MNQGNFLDIAAIHGTILAITMAALGIFMSLTYERKSQIIEKILNKQQEVVALFAPMTLFIHGSNTPQYDTSDEKIRAKHLDKAVKLAMGVPDFNDLPPTDDFVARGMLLIDMLSGLVHHYPFVRSLERTGVQSDSTLEDCKEWYRRLSKEMSAFTWISSEPSKEKVMQLVNAVQQNKNERDRKELEERQKKFEEILTKINTPPQEAEKLRQTFLPSSSQGLSEQEYLSFIQGLFSAIQTTIGILANVSKELEAIGYFDNKTHPARITTLILSVFLTAMFGILLPMTHEFFPLLNDNKFTYILYVFIPFWGHIVTGSVVYLMMRF